MKPDDRRQFGALMRLAEFRRLRRVTRLQTEWKVSLGTWGLLAAVSWYTKGAANPMLPFLVAATAVTHIWFWVRWNWIANERDARLAMYYAEKAEQMILPNDAPKTEQRPKLSKKEELIGFVSHGPPMFQCLATLLLGLLAVSSN
jgi:hypothetical protein